MRRGRAGLVFAALALVGVIALAVFPTKALLAQRRERTQLDAQVAQLSAQNDALQARTDQLGTDAEIERLARQYNLVMPGEEAYFILPQPGAAAPAAADGPQAATATAPVPAKPSPSLWTRLKSLF
jgi:cell division protein FtsB